MQKKKLDDQLRRLQDSAREEKKKGQKRESQSQSGRLINGAKKEKSRRLVLRPHSWPFASPPSPPFMAKYTSGIHITAKKAKKARKQAQQANSHVRHYIPTNIIA